LLFAVVYLLLRRLVALAGGSAEDRHSDIEVPVLCHQLAVHRRSRPAIVDRIKPTPGSPATNSEKQQPNGSSDIIERTTAKKIKAPSTPHAVTVIHTCRDHQRCSAVPGLGFMAHLYANRDSHIGASAQSIQGRGEEGRRADFPASVRRMT